MSINKVFSESAKIKKIRLVCSLVNFFIFLAFVFGLSLSYNDLLVIFCIFVSIVLFEFLFLAMMFNYPRGKLSYHCLSGKNLAKAQILEHRSKSKSVYYFGAGGVGLLAVFDFPTPELANESINNCSFRLLAERGVLNPNTWDFNYPDADCSAYFYDEKGGLSAGFVHGERIF